MNGKNDPKTYRELSFPFETPELADEKLRMFFNAVEAARKEFHIMDVHVIVKININRGESEGAAMASAHFGNTLEAAQMCAWALGQEEADMRAALREFVKGG